MPERFSLANRDHLDVFLQVLVLMGGACHRCGHATRKTSKRWARCKGCGERVRRRSEAEIEAMVKEAEG